jgi:hypothetical protein
MSLKYSTKERVQAKAIAKMIGFTRKLPLIRLKLRGAGFRLAGSGTYKFTYHNPKYPTLVVKVYRSRSGYVEDTSKGFLTPKQAEFFLTPVVHNRRFIIQKKFNGKGGTKYRAEAKINACLRYSLCDVTDGNCAYHDGKPYFFDYCS